VGVTALHATAEIHMRLASGNVNKIVLNFMSAKHSFCVPINDPVNDHVNELKM